MRSGLIVGVLLVVFGIIWHAKSKVLTALWMTIFNFFFGGCSNTFNLHPKAQSHSR